MWYHMWTTFISERLPTDFPSFSIWKVSFTYMCGNCDYTLIFKSHFFKDKAPCNYFRNKLKVALRPMLILFLSKIFPWLFCGIYRRSSVSKRKNKQTCYLLFTLLIFFFVSIQLTETYFVITTALICTFSPFSSVIPRLFWFVLEYITFKDFILMGDLSLFFLVISLNQMCNFTMLPLGEFLPN